VLGSSQTLQITKDYEKGKEQFSKTKKKKENLQLLVRHTWNFSSC
jgi:hypothetical protein